MYWRVFMYISIILDLFHTSKTAMEILKQKCNTIEKCFKMQNWNQLGQLLKDVKLTLTELSLVPLDDNVPLDAAVYARSILEIGVQCSVFLEDITSFESYIAMLKVYYNDFGDQLPHSTKMYEIVGLNLMHLLSKNEIMQFHTELELLDSKIILEDPFVSFAVKLEQDIMAGNYKKAMEGTLPSPTFKLFTDLLLVTIREEIAKGMPIAYDEISVEGCKKMLNFELTDEGEDKGGLLANELTKDWKVVPKWGPMHNINFIQFQNKASEEKSQGKNVNDSCIELAKMAISYAKEYEQIV